MDERVRDCGGCVRGVLTGYGARRVRRTRRVRESRYSEESTGWFSSSKLVRRTQLPFVLQLFVITRI